MIFATYQRMREKGTSWDGTRLKDFNIKPVLTKVNNPQANAPVEQIHQVILNIIVTEDPDNKVFDYIYPWGEILAHIT